MRTVRMFCIIVGSVLAAFLVPLAVRARLASPRPVEAPVTATVWEGTTTQQISNNNLEDFTGEPGMNFYPALAVVSPTVAAAWSRQVGSNTLGYYDPYYRYSSNNGEAGWGPQNNISSTAPITTETTRVDVAVDSDNGFHFVWSEQTGTPYSYTLFYSYTNASSIEIITGTTNDVALATPSIAVHSNQAVHVVWSQGEGSINYISKTIGGAWGSSTNITTSASLAVHPAIAVDGAGKAHVVWSEGDSDNEADIFYKNSNWSTTLYKVFDAASSGGRSPAIAVYGNTVYVVWCEFINKGEQYVGFRQSADGGSNWGGVERISQGAFAANQDSPNWLRPVIAVDINEKIHVAFNGAGAISDPEDIYYVSKTKDGTWGSRPRENVTSSNGENDTTPDIATGGEYVHLIWAGPPGPGFPPPDNKYEVLYKRASIVEEEGVYLPIIMKSAS